MGAYGWHVVKVLEDSRDPPFAYTVGLFQTFGHAEILVIGLPHPVAHVLLNDVGAAARAGRRFQVGRRYAELLVGYECTFREVPRRGYPSYLGRALWFYGRTTFPALQLVYPDRHGRWPWQEGVSPEFRARQPVIANAHDPP